MSEGGLIVLGERDLNQRSVEIARSV